MFSVVANQVGRFVMLYYLAYQHCIGYEIIAGKFYPVSTNKKIIMALITPIFNSIYK
jgi:hypothetical protein